MQIRKILVGTDFSKEAESATEHALGLAARHGSELILMHAVNLSMHHDSLPYLETMPESYASHVAAIQEDLQNKLNTVIQSFDGRGVGISMLFVDQSPETAIVRVASEEDIDLVVVGSHGRSGLKRLLIGSVSETVARDAPGDVLVVRSKASADRYQRILVPTDFSECSEKAVARAIGLAEEGGVIELLHCWQLPGGPLAYWGTTGKDLRKSCQEGAEAFGARCVSEHAGAKVTLQFSQKEGDACQSVQERVEQGGVDLVVLGTHGRKRLQRLLLGSVAQNLLRHLPSSVYLVR